MLLRSAHLVWKSFGGKDSPWKTHHLYLHCAIDNQLWSKTGMEQVRLEKIEQTEKQIDNCKAKAKEKSLNRDQQKYLKRLQSSLERLKTFDIAQLNPNHSSNYQSNPHIILGVSIGLKTPVTVVIINLKTQATIAHRSPKQLLKRTHQILAPKDKTNSNRQEKREINDYQLFQRYLLKKQANKHERHKAQPKFADNQLGEANAGLYFNRLFAQSIISFAQTYQVSLIVLPDLKNIREIIEAEVRARAELKYPGNKTQQKRYAKDFRSTVNQWSYRQLSQCITNTALKTGIEIVTHHQTTKGSPQQKARQIALHFCEKQL